MDTTTIVNKGHNFSVRFDVLKLYPRIYSEQLKPLLNDRIGYTVDILWQTVCWVVEAIKVKRVAALIAR